MGTARRENAAAVLDRTAIASTVVTIARTGHEALRALERGSGGTASASWGGAKPSELDRIVTLLSQTKPMCAKRCCVAVLEHSRRRADGRVMRLGIRK